jgi:hypothetical protein
MEVPQLHVAKGAQDKTAAERAAVFGGAQKGVGRG